MIGGVGAVLVGLCCDGVDFGLLCAIVVCYPMVECGPDLLG